MKKEIKIALVAVVGLIVLFFGMNFLKGLKLFSSDTEYLMAFKDISGLGTSTPIYANGYRVGVVRSIDYDYTQQNKDIMVGVDIDPNLRIPEGSTAEISSDLLGNLQVKLKLADNQTAFLKPGDIIQGSINEGAMGKLREMVPTIERMIPKLDSIMGSLNLLLADPAIAQTLHNAEHISSGLVKTTSEVNTLMAQLNRNVPGVMTKAGTTLDNTTEVMTNVNNKLSELDLQATMEKLNATLANMEALSAQLKSSEGTLGLLMNDPTLYNNLNSTMRSADSLLVNFREHPKRYVHFSVFGKKDK